MLCFDAAAHALLLKSEPALRAQLSKAPSAVRLWFNERLEPDYATITVLDSGGQSITQTRARLAADNAKLLTLPLPALTPGKYTVKFHVLSVDGHAVKSEFVFTVKAQ